MADLIQQSDELRVSIAEKLTENIPDLERRIYERILRLLEEFPNAGGKFDREKVNLKLILSLHGEIEDIIERSGYFASVNAYITDLELITENTIALHKAFNDKTIAKGLIKPFQQIQAQKAVENFAEAGLSVNFVQPVTEVIYQAVAFGASVNDTRKALSDLIVGNEDKVGRLQSYLTVTARDTVTQLQGQQHQAVQKAYNMPYIRYVGGLLKDSRGQCVRWKKMGVIAIADLQEELKLAYAKQRAKAEETPGHKYGGMMPNTTVDNFLQNRGGFGCLHQAIPVRVKK